MQMEEKCTIHGYVEIVDAKTGEVLRTAENLVVTSGCAFIADLLSGAGVPPMQYMGVGSDGTTPAAGQTALLSEIVDGNRILATVSKPTSTQVRFTGTWAAGRHTGTWREMGVFNHATSGSGTMLSRIAFPALTKLSGDTFQIFYTLSVSGT